MPRDIPRLLAALVEQQDGVVSRRQLLDAGLTRSQAVQRVRSGWWQRVHPGVYATFTGPVSDRGRVAAALLVAGPASAAGFETALWLAGFTRTMPDVIQICIPHGEKRVPPRGIRFIQRRNLDASILPGSLPARVRFEDCIIDVTHRASGAQAVITVVLEAVQRRFTTVERLRAALFCRSRHRWRSLLAELLTEAEEGVASGLERRYLRDVERAHGLPRGLRNRPRATPRGRQYTDVYYAEWRTVAELDGRIAHPVYEAFRDWRRDNATTIAGDWTLRYGWVDVVTNPCAMAEQVAQVLRNQGWNGRLKRCPRCQERSEYIGISGRCGSPPTMAAPPRR